MKKTKALFYLKIVIKKLINVLKIKRKKYNKIEASILKKATSSSTLLKNVRRY